MKPNLGDVIADKYRLDRLLGEGGMSMVFAAVNVLTGKQVAIKWLQPEIIRDEEQSQRLLREAQAASSIDHPNVVNVFDVGRHEGALFLVMEHLHGEPLSELLARGRQEPVQFIRLMMPVLRGVQAAHRMGVVHRDLKPDNIFFCRDPHGEPREPKVLDFGISKLAGDDLPAGQQLTREGTVFGTPQYMAPEQMRDARVADVRSDVYALGVLFYRAFADQFPYDADTLTALAIRIVEGDAVPLQELCPDLDLQLADIVMRALALDPEHRYQSVAAFAQALEPFADGMQFVPVVERESAPSLRRDSSPDPLDASHSLRPRQAPLDSQMWRNSRPVHHSQSPQRPLVEHRDSIPPTPPSTGGGLPAGTTVLTMNDFLEEQRAVRTSSGPLRNALHIPPPPVAPRPSRGHDVPLTGSDTTQRLTLPATSRKRSLLVGVTLFAVGSIAPVAWQLMHKADHVDSEHAPAVSSEIPSTRFAMATAKRSAEEEREKQALAEQPTAPVAPPPRARSEESVFTSQAPEEAVEVEVQGLEAPDALPTAPGLRLRPKKVIKNHTRASNGVLRQPAGAQSPAAATPPATLPELQAAPTLELQTERNPYLR